MIFNVNYLLVFILNKSPYISTLVELFSFRLHHTFEQNVVSVKVELKHKRQILGVSAMMLTLLVTIAGLFRYELSTKI